MKNEDYLNALIQEVNFWSEWFKTKGIHWPKDYQNRINPDFELQPEYLGFIKTGDEKILDVGSGPITMLGKKLNGRRLIIVCTDILADEFEGLFLKYKINPENKPVKVSAEKLLKHFKQKKFDFIHAQNSIDHCADPVKAISEMVKLLKKNGDIYLRHEVNEGENEKYSGLHQWNFNLKDGKFVIWGNDTETFMEDYFEGSVTIESTIDKGYIINIIRKV